MSSHESDQLKVMYQNWIAEMSAKPDMGLEELRRMFNHWGDVGADPGGVDYIEDNINEMTAMWAIPKGCDEEKVLLCTHGGGFVTGSIYSHRKMFAHIAKAVGCRALLVNYGLAPENPHPGPLNDMVAAYEWLLSDKGIKPENIVMVGDSAGGNLSITMIARALEQGLPSPAASVPISPWAGWDTSGETYETNADKDALVSRDTTNTMGSMWIGENGDPKDPMANPLYTDYTGVPPIYIQVGADETVLDDSYRIAARAKQAGVDVKLDVYPGMQHVFQMLAGEAPEADAAVKEMAAWIRSKLNIN